MNKPQFIDAKDGTPKAGWIIFGQTAISTVFIVNAWFSDMPTNRFLIGAAVLVIFTLADYSVYIGRKTALELGKMKVTIEGAKSEAAKVESRRPPDPAGEGTVVNVGTEPEERRGK